MFYRVIQCLRFRLAMRGMWKNFVNSNRSGFVPVCALAGFCMLIGCAEVPREPVQQAPPLVFPAPPETPRFVFERTIQRSTDLEAADQRGGFRRAITGSVKGFA